MIEEENVSYPWKVRFRAFSFKVTLKFESDPTRQLNSLNLRGSLKIKCSGLKLNEFNCFFGSLALDPHGTQGRGLAGPLN